jgi:hypothetical protein
MNIFIEILRKFTPTIGEVTYNEVIMPLKYFQEKPIGGRLSHPNNEGGMVNCHKQLTRLNDQVCVIGGGKGISAVHAWWLSAVPPIVFEGSAHQCKILLAVFERNNVIAEVHNRIVGTPFNVYVGTRGTPMPHMEDIPECDVLDLDCEGAEVEILEHIKARPRVLIIELHPWLYKDGKNSDYILALVNKLGYTIEYTYGHDGQLIGSELMELLRLSEVNAGGQQSLVEGGPRYPVVIGCVRDKLTKKEKKEKFAVDASIPNVSPSVVTSVCRI